MCDVESKKHFCNFKFSRQDEGGNDASLLVNLFSGEELSFRPITDDKSVGTGACDTEGGLSKRCRD